MPKLLVLMRGLPGCGKSFTARRLIAKGGVALEFDAFFHSTPGDPGSYRFRADQRGAARRWHWARIRRAVDAGTSPIVLDDDHRASRSARRYAAYALRAGYSVVLGEPESPWWRTLRVHLGDKDAHQAELERWASSLERLNRTTHGVSRESLLARIESWQPQLTVADILGLTPPTNNAASTKEPTP